MMRMRAGPDLPTPLMATYYARRASGGGLIIAEATPVSPRGIGYVHTPGIFTNGASCGLAEDHSGSACQGGTDIPSALAFRPAVASTCCSEGQMVPIAPSALAAEGEAHLSKVRCPILYRALSHVVGL